MCGMYDLMCKKMSALSFPWLLIGYHGNLTSNLDQYYNSLSSCFVIVVSCPCLPNVFLSHLRIPSLLCLTFTMCSNLTEPNSLSIVFKCAKVPFII